MPSHKYRPICAEGALLLTEAIVWQASLDWREASEILRTKEREDMYTLKKEAETFFLSAWFYELTGLNGGKIIDGLNKAFEGGGMIEAEA
ncbi:MAG: hypothetical protein IKN04_10470 [Clostridia bacterium]|nr:hypothetical protein [Clostridia bacterium]